MDLIHYLGKKMEGELIESPFSAWKWFEGKRLQPYILDSTKKQTDIENILCYSEKNLYIIVKTNQEVLKYRDRSYQNGDGFHFVLAKPREDYLPTNEFYVIAISPLDTSWRNKFIWYKNVDLSMKSLETTKVEIYKKGREHFILVQIPWNEIEPLKGLLFKAYGFNISYVQSVKEGKNIYMLKEDRYIQNELSPREYLVYKFEEPKAIEQIEYHIDLSTKHCDTSQMVFIKIAIVGDRKIQFELKVLEQNTIILREHFEACEGLTRIEFPLIISKLSHGNHKLTIELNSKSFHAKEERNIYIYDQTRFKRLSEDIKKLWDENDEEGRIKESIASLRFYDKNLWKLLTVLKSYESFDGIQYFYEKITEDLKKVRAGDHLFEKGKIVRLGHLSQLDNSLEPYSIFIPSNYKENENYKLLVFLHGSGSDDRSIKNNVLLHRFAEEHNMILLAPYARGTSHFYCTKEAMEDVVELTIKISRLLSIKDNHILLGGFSMGGYGAYRIYDYSPQLFHGLVVFSGHHSLGETYGGADYSKDDKLPLFERIPMIVFHGTEDRNCSYEELKPFFNKLSDQRNKCEIHIKNDVGHSCLIKEWYEPLAEWISKHY
ncbi:MAG: phospholipase [Firmicutes bacterium]|nr:phospholipase [Bacillota bacterium]